MNAGRQRLKDWIKRSQLTQRDAARILGCGEVVLSQWLSGTRRPGLDNAVTIEQITGISVESWLRTPVSITPAEVTGDRRKRSIASR